MASMVPFASRERRVILATHTRRKTKLIEPNKMPTCAGMGVGGKKLGDKWRCGLARKMGRWMEPKKIPPVEGAGEP
jgi:hypothetical protein